MILGGGKFWIKFSEKFPIIFWKNFDIKKLPEYLSIKQKNKN